MNTFREYLQQSDRIEQLIADARPTLQHEAVHELARRDKRLLLMDMAEFLDPAPHGTWLAAAAASEAETAYRRGYWHGYSRAMDDIKRARKRHRSFVRGWQALAEFFDGALTRWRYADKPRRFDPPPNFPPALPGTAGHTWHDPADKPMR